MFLWGGVVVVVMVVVTSGGGGGGDGGAFAVDVVNDASILYCVFCAL